MANTLETVGTSLLTCFFLAALTLCGCRSPEVEVIHPSRTVLEESFTEQARTRLPRSYPILMPVSAHLERLNVLPGDEVTKGQVLAALVREPFQHRVTEAAARVREVEAELRVADDHTMEQTALLEALAIVRAASEALKAADAQVAAERARSERATRELDRTLRLAQGEVVPQTQLEDIELAAETALIELREQEFNRAALGAFVTAVQLGPRLVREFLALKKLQRVEIEERLVGARANLELAQHDLRTAVIESPCSGTVLEKYIEGGGFIQRGKELLLLGDLNELEAVSDLLTVNALRIGSDTTVRISTTDGSRLMAGYIKRVEPMGFTKQSSLGIDQQRIRVVIGFEEPPMFMGVGYELEASFVAQRKESALVVPRVSVLQQPSGNYYVQKVEGNRIVNQTVIVGLQTDLALEVTSGLEETDRFIYLPDADQGEGVRVRVEEKTRSVLGNPGR